MHKTTRLVTLLGALVAPAFTLADTAAPAAAPADPPKPPPWYSVVTVTGLVDASAQTRIDASQNYPITQRAFDAASGFSVGYGKLSVSAAPAPVGFRVDLGFGATADVIDAVTSLAQHQAAGTSTAGHYVQQAYAAFKLGPVELDVGRFSTSAGAEVIEAKDNWLYSRSLTFNLEPLTHTGAKLVYGLTDQLTVTVGLVNGWDAVVAPTNGASTGQLSLAWIGPSSTTLAATVYVGANPVLWSGALNTTGELRTFVDLVAGTTVGPVSLLANFDYGTETQPAGAASQAYWAASLAARYAFPNDVARFTVRGEYVKDDQGARFATGVDTAVYEGTAGLSVPVGSNGELRAELRYDHADQPIFTASSPTKDQVTATLAALAWF